MYSLVLTVMASAFLIVLGCGFVLGPLILMAYEFSPWFLLLIALGILFASVGVRSIIQTVRFLRGGRKQKDWQQWIFAAPPHHDPDEGSQNY